ncbi:unnamed protein product [Mytilus coruscus]|uniref:Uncharacterized protein n=1 Tax=Mytilus coruscus TaxID=42192 RepID=A0A6J8A145_MYTCO|nr:unnamed protein product [Mytilus coruscus]
MQNTCQAIVKPDCTKSTTNKSLGVKKALTSILKICLTELTTNPSTSEEILPSMNDLLMFDFKCVPNHISSNTKVAIVEFAGAKFKTFATTGESYIKYVTGGLGKKAVSNYLGKHLTELDIQADIIIDVDSEAVYGQCQCEDLDKCTCPLFTTPVRAVFTQGNGFQHSENLTMIKQRKGEAEMSQADWLKDVQLQLHDGECVYKLCDISRHRHYCYSNLCRASLPNFMASGCLKVRQDGSTIYNLGPNCHIDNRDNLITVSEETLTNKLKGTYSPSK